MSNMGMGMDKGSDGMFRPVNQMVARTYWYLVAAFFALGLLLKGVGAIQSWERSVAYPPKGWETSSPQAKPLEKRLTCSLQVNAHPVPFPFLTLRDLEIWRPKLMQRHLQSSEKYPILKWSSLLGQVGRG